MNRRIQHRDLEDTEPGKARNLCVLQNSVLNQGYARWTARFMAPMRVHCWRSRLSTNAPAANGAGTAIDSAATDPQRIYRVGYPE